MKFDRVAVTGGSGRLGRYVVEELSGHAEVTVLDLTPPAAGLAYAALDVRDLDAVAAALAGHDAVVHLAGIDDGVPVPDKTYFETNVQGSWNVLHAAHELGIRKVVLASSSAAQGLGSRDRPPLYLPIDEDHPPRPSVVYALSKLMVETIAASFGRRGKMETVCLRPTLVARPEAIGAMAEQVAFLAARGVAALEPGDTTPQPYQPLPGLRSYVTSRDAARAFRCALEFAGLRSLVVNIAAADSVGGTATLDHLRAVYGALPEVRKPALYAARPDASAIDTARARDLLGWQSEKDWPAVVAEHAPNTKDQ